MKTESDPDAALDLDRLLTLAAEHRPDTAAAELGFATRLSANLSSLRRDGEAPGRSFWDDALAWLWGGAAGAAPVVVGMALWFFVANGLDINLSMESGFDGLFTHLTSYLPFDGSW